MPSFFRLTFLGKWVSCMEFLPKATVDYFHSARHRAHYAMGTVPIEYLRTMYDTRKHSPTHRLANKYRYQSKIVMTH